MSIPFLAAMCQNFSAPVRPSSAVYTGTTPTNPTYAYDGTAAAVDTTTSATLYTIGLRTSTQIYTFAAGTQSGTLHVYFTKVITAYMDSPTLTYAATSSVQLDVMVDGTTYVNRALWDSGLDPALPYDYTLALTSQNLANLKVKITTISQTVGPALDRAIADVNCDISDIVVL